MIQRLSSAHGAPAASDQPIVRGAATMREHWSPIFALLRARPDQCGDVIGDFEAAVAEINLATAAIEDATDDTGTDKDWASTIIGVRALIDVDRGHLGAAAARLAEWARNAPPGQCGSPGTALARIELLNARGNHDEAADLAIKLWTHAVDHDDEILLRTNGPRIARTALLADEPALLHTVAERLRTLDTNPRTIQAPTVTLVTAMENSDSTGAAVAARMCERACDALGHLLALEEAACAAAANGNISGSRTYAVRTIDLASRIGMRTTERRLTARLREFGVRLGVRGRRQRPTHGWESLTPTEMRIAELIATGLDGKQISAQLFISRSTVQTHVSHALAKLGLHSRLELAAELTRRNQPM